MKNISDNFVNILNERGFVQDSTDINVLQSELSKGNRTAYIGYDATAKSLHVGHLVNIMMLRWFQKCGHQPITLMGGGTTKVGDPSFRSNERPLLSENEIENNIKSMNSVFQKYLNYKTSKNKAIMVNNSEWLDKINYLDFLRNIGRYFSVNRMLSFDSVKSRLERDQTLSFLEFNYMILQAYDFLELNKRYDCILQMGGSDQWGNIINGIDLNRRVSSKTVFGITSPLLTSASGQKMGKSQTGAIWLNSDLTTPYEFWQFWRDTDDRDVEKFLLLFTEASVSECKKLGKLQGCKINEAKIFLANEVTAMCHGRKNAEKAEKTANQIFNEGVLGDHLPSLSITKSEIDNNSTVGYLFVKTGLVKSGKEAKRLISEGGARVNDKTITNSALKILELDINNPIRLSAGKKRHFMVIIS